MFLFKLAQNADSSTPVRVSEPCRRSRKGAQAFFYALLAELTPCDWHATLKRKLGFLVADPHDGWSLTCDTESKLRLFLKQLGVRAATAVIKTWSNTWATSSRLHEEKRLKCFFGCDAPDDLNHYLCCDPLWTAIISNGSARVGLLWTRPMTRIGMINPSLEWLQMVCIAYSCYHSIKFDHMQEVLACQPDSGDPYQVHCRLMNYARVYRKDYGF